MEHESDGIVYTYTQYSFNRRKNVDNIYFINNIILNFVYNFIFSKNSIVKESRVDVIYSKNVALFKVYNLILFTPKNRFLFNV